MRRLFLLVYSMFILICYARSQVSETYSLDRVTEDIDCYLNLYKNGSYYIELQENLTSDIGKSIVLSYGKYKVNGNRMVLIDKVHNFSMEVITDKSKIKFVNSFVFLLNKQFNYYDENTDREPTILKSGISSFKLKEERKEYKKEHQILFSFNVGIYHDNQGYRLIIQQNNKYKVEYKGIIISDGDWCRDGNELELKDRYLNRSFYALINDKYIISKLLPGEYRGRNLVRINRKKQ